MGGEEKKKTESPKEKSLGGGEEEEKVKKQYRLLSIYTKLMDGETVVKSEEADRYGVSEKSIQRDIGDLRAFLTQKSVKQGYVDTIESLNDGRYWMKKRRESTISEGEAIALCKILLGSRALENKEMNHMLDALLNHCVQKKDRKKIEKVIGNERLWYVEPRHKTLLTRTMLLVNPILGLQPKYTKQDFEKLRSSESDAVRGYFTNHESMVISMANLLYKITLDDKDKKLLAKSLRKNKEFLSSVKMSKKEFGVEDIAMIERALNHKYKYSTY